MRYLPLLLILLVSCSHKLAPPKTWLLGTELNEISGLGFRDGVCFGHNDSGDGPHLYRFELGASSSTVEELTAGAVDYEDLTQDPAGNWYLGDFGDNYRRRNDLKIYRYQPSNRNLDTIHFTYGAGVNHHNCEAMVYQGGYLHLFTKASGGGRGRYWAYHYRFPAEPGIQEAMLVDSLYLPRRMITAAAIDSTNNQLLLTAYNYKKVLGFFPAAASSLIQFSNYSGDRFFQGDMERRNLSWAIPNQVEAVDYYDGRYFYIARERTPLARARIKRKRRF